jgi:hypothetical protein
MITVIEILAWILVWPLIALLIDRLIHPNTPERRVGRLLGWYPRAWRERHGDEFGELLHDAIADGRDDRRMTVDVARAGLGERLRATSARRIAGGFLIGTGWTMVIPQGIIAAILAAIGTPPLGFVALRADGAARWLICGAMIAVGLLLVDRGMRLAAWTRPRPQSAG